MNTRFGDTTSTDGWSPERIETLRKLWAEGLSASHSQVAAKLGGVSRSAVCGKVKRLKITRRSHGASPPKPLPLAKPVQAVKLAAPKADVAPSVPPTPAEPFWTPERINTLRSMWGSDRETILNIVLKLGRNEVEVRDQAHKLGLGRKKRFRGGFMLGNGQASTGEPKPQRSGYFVPDATRVSARRANEARLERREATDRYPASIFDAHFK